MAPRMPSIATMSTASRLEPVGRRVGLEGARQPERTAQPARARAPAAPWRATRGRPRSDSVGVHDDVAVAVVGPGPASRVTFWCQQCWPLTGSGCTGNVRFWWTPASSHQTRCESGSSLSNGRTPWMCRSRHCPGPGCCERRRARWTSARRRVCSASRQRPEVMRARDDAGPDRLGHPHPVHEVADLGRDLQEIAGRRRRAAPRPRDGARAGWCARSRRATWRCRSASGSGSAAGRWAGAAISPRGRGRSRDQCTWLRA